PVVLTLLQHPGPGERDTDPRIAVPPSRFQQQHAQVSILAQAIGQSAAGRAGADDDVGVLFAPHDRLLSGNGIATRGSYDPSQALPHIGKALPQRGGLNMGGPMPPFETTEELPAITESRRAPIPAAVARFEIRYSRFLDPKGNAVGP